VGRLFTTTVRRWTPVVGQERLPSPGDPGRVAVEDTIHRLFVDGVSARDAEVYFDRTYHDDICIHEAPSLPCGGDYHGLEGVARHAIGFTRTWDRWQTGEQRQLGPRIIATDTEAIVLWTLRAQQPGDPAESTFPAISHYRSMTGVGRVTHVPLRHRGGAGLSRTCRQLVTPVRFTRMVSAVFGSFFLGIHCAPSESVYSSLKT
jgi:hypothetical protein